MALISRLSPDDTIRQFRVAATLRFREACHLAAEDMRLGSLYLLGYSAEMLLKSAYFRLMAKGADDPIRRVDFDLARTAAVRLGISRGRNLHDLRWWFDLLVQSRQASGRVYSRRFVGLLFNAVRHIDANWRETLRYRGNRPRYSELRDATNSIQWMLRVYRSL